MKLTKEYRFEASHQIPNHPGKCARLHGHSWVLIMECEGLVDDKTGMVIDYYLINDEVKPIVERLDHNHLGAGVIRNTVSGMSYHLLPTSEKLLWWIADQLNPNFPWSALTLKETCTSSATLSRQEWEESVRKETYYGENETGTFEERSKETWQEAKKRLEVITDDDIPF